MKSVASIKESMLIDSISWLSLFIIVGSACFQFEYSFPILTALFSLLSKIVFVLSSLICAISAYKHKRHLIYSFDYLLLLYFIWLVFASFLNGHSWITQVPFIMKALALRNIVILYLVKKQFRIIPLLSTVFSSIVYLNFIQLIFLPNTLGHVDGDKVYLITTNYNQFGAVFLPAIFIKVIDYFKNGGIYSLLLLLSVCMLSAGLEGSATTTVSILLFTVLFLFVKSPSLLKTVNLSILGAIAAFYFTFVMPIFSVLNIPFISDFVSSLGKDMTFSNRTSIWEIANYHISNNLILGQGVCDKDTYQELLMNAVNPHNIILHNLIQGGLVGFLLFMLFSFYGVKNILNIRNEYIRMLMLTICLVFLLMLQFEVYTNTFIYIFIFLMYISRDFINYKNIRNV